MCSLIFKCFPPYLPGFIEAALHCIYSAFFVIEAATHGLNLEQKFHGALQILLINLYIVLLCLLVLRWHVSRRRLGCHLVMSLASCILSLLIGQMILMYLDHMEKTSKLWNQNDPRDSLKMELVVLILDILVYLVITSTYIIFLIRISVQIHKTVTASDREYELTV